MLIFRQSLVFLAPLCLILTISHGETTPAASPAGGVTESFDAKENLVIEKGYKCTQADAVIHPEDKQEGAASLQTTWDTSESQYGEMKIIRKIQPMDATGATCEVWIKPLTADAYGWGVQLYDSADMLVEEQRIWILKKDEWNVIRFTIGTPLPKGLGTYYKSGDGDVTKVAKVIFRAAVKTAGQPQQALWDGFSLRKG